MVNFIRSEPDRGIFRRSDSDPFYLMAESGSTRIRNPAFPQTCTVTFFVVIYGSISKIFNNLIRCSYFFPLCSCFLYLYCSFPLLNSIQSSLIKKSKIFSKISIQAFYAAVDSSVQENLRVT